jgi:non-specific serine/threonine protein kinase/serine/threonine-protein kinase
MEYVKGESITAFADRAALSIHDRLALFLQVCDGVQHAHQKGIIHRDLKPSNILVAPRDGRPVPIIIDFGVAKATTMSLTDRTIYTELGSLIGTLEYMSPAQAQVTAADVDTRADVYSLGVILSSC